MKAFEAMATRSVNAERDFLSVLMQAGGISYDQAERVFALYRKLRVLKFDRVSGTVRVKHGAFLDRETIHNALNQ